MVREPIFCFWKGKELFLGGDSLNPCRNPKVSDGSAGFVARAGLEPGVWVG